MAKKIIKKPKNCLTWPKVYITILFSFRLNYLPLILYFFPLADICKKSLLSEDYTEDKIEIELGTINTQLGYVYQLQGRISEAIEIYQNILKAKGMDTTVSAIASNNLVAAKKDSELFDSARKLRIASSKHLDTKLFRGQKRVIAMNEALLSLYMHKASKSSVFF